MIVGRGSRKGSNGSGVFSRDSGDSDGVNINRGGSSRSGGGSVCTMWGGAIGSRSTNGGMVAMAAEKLFIIIVD